MPPKRKVAPTKAPPKGKGKGKSAPPKSSKAPAPKRKTNPEPATPETQPRTKIPKYDIVFSPEETLEPIPGPWDERVRSIGARERTRFKMSRSSLDSEYEITPEELNAFASTLKGGSAESFGLTKIGPQKATTKKRRRGVGIRGSCGSEDVVDVGEQLGILRRFATPRVAVPNVPGEERKFILRTSREIREVIYSFLFVYSQPIRVKYTWDEVERNSHGRRNAYKLIRVCKLFAFEVPSFLLRNNTIHALLRKPYSGYIGYLLHEVPRKIPLGLLANVRNLVLDCAKDCWNLEWFRRTSRGLMNLANATPNIQSLTLVLAPYRELRTQTALGIEANPLTFADFLWWDGKVIRAIRRLAPKVFKVVAKKDNKEFLFEVDMSGYMTTPQTDLFEMSMLTSQPAQEANTCTVAKAKANRKSQVIEEKLKGLKSLLEEIFDDETKVLAQGRCTVKVLGEHIPSAKKRKAVEVIDLASDTEDDNNSSASAEIAPMDDKVKVEKVDLLSISAATQSSASTVANSEDQGSFLTHQEWRSFAGYEPEPESETDADNSEDEADY